MASFSIALIVTEPGRFRDALHTLVASIDQLEVVDATPESLPALQSAFRLYPTLLFLDMDLFEEYVWVILQQVQASYHTVRCIALVSNSRQQRLARRAGADEVLLKGFSAAELYSVTQRLLTQIDRPAVGIS